VEVLPLPLSLPMTELGEKYCTVFSVNSKLG
jgi:hypothetical protein